MHGEPSWGQLVQATRGFPDVNLAGQKVAEHIDDACRSWVRQVGHPPNNEFYGPA
jgi:hypothetical protein